MSLAASSVITVHGVDGSVWRVHGPGSGGDGVYLATSPQGIYDAPVTSMWTKSAYRPGAVWGGVRFEPMDLVLAFHITPGDREWHAVDSAWRRAWSYTEDTVIEVETLAYGSRRLRVRMLEAPKTVTEYDPHVMEYAEVILTLRAGNPLYYGEATTTTFRPAPGVPSLVTEHEVTNLGGVEMWPIWEKSGPGIWIIPDHSPGTPDRRIQMPDQLHEVDYVVNTTPGEEQLVSPGNENVWAVMGVTRFVHPFEANAKVTVPVSGSGLTNASTLTLITRPVYTRPWGTS